MGKMASAAISIFVPHEGCPHDCVFCNQRTISGTVKSPEVEDIRAAVLRALESGVDTSTAEIAFFGGSFTAIERGKMLKYLDTADKLVKEFSLFGIRFSTRPDCVEDEVLDILAGYPVTTVELGIQSTDEEVLRLSGRGHTAADGIHAMERVSLRGYTLIAQMMTGLPGDSLEKSLKTAGDIIAAKPHGVRIYPTLVLRGTALGELYLSGRYAPEKMDEAVSLAARLLTKFADAGIPVVKLGLHAADGLDGGRDLLAGPYHPAFRELAEGAVYRDILDGELIGYDFGADRKIVVEVPLGTTSKVAGHRAENRVYFTQKYGLNSLKIVENSSLNQYKLRIVSNKST